MKDQVSDFLQGQKDCRNGKPHKSGSTEYNRGYSVEYELEQMRTHRSLQNGR
jgi:hypothetical protein